ncbi:unnamed protein product [Blepharisma stoltei]|uniref:Uncharacterized protein n=1 Tax=Blepharisma stoltei TaxID=1481888 RepID=A0AAU9IVU2_9CILI|nr:unnamed protein product [Blepharisma stoltei]
MENSSILEASTNIDELITGNTSEEKLQNAKEILEMMEKEIFRLRAELKRSEQTVKKLQDSLALQAQNQNNTSSSFLLPSEFKKNWEVLVQENILDVFSPFLGSHTLFVRLVQSLMKICMEFVENTIRCKMSEIKKLLGITNEETENLKKYLMKLFQDYCETAVPEIDFWEFLKVYKDKISDFIDEEHEEDFEYMITSDEFIEFVKKTHQLVLHIVFHDPSLDLNFPGKIEYITLEKPDEYYCIDGFPKNSPPCVIVVPAIMRGNFAYQGIKPAVLVITTEQMNEQKEKASQKSEKSDQDSLKSERSSKPPLKNCKSLNINLRSLSPQDKNQENPIFGLYYRYKTKINSMRSDEESQETPNKSPFKYSVDYMPSPKSISEDSTRSMIKGPDSIPISSATYYSRKKRREACTLCRPKLPCKKCSKNALLDIAKRIPSGAYSQKHTTPMRVYSSSFFESSNRNDRSYPMTSLLTRKLSEAAKKMDRKSSVKSKIVDKDTCMVM